MCRACSMQRSYVDCRCSRLTIWRVAIEAGSLDDVLRQEVDRWLPLKQAHLTSLFDLAWSYEPVWQLLVVNQDSIDPSPIRYWGLALAHQWPKERLARSSNSARTVVEPHKESTGFFHHTDTLQHHLPPLQLRLSLLLQVHESYIPWHTQTHTHIPT